MRDVDLDMGEDERSYADNVGLLMRDEYNYFFSRFVSDSVSFKI